MKSAIKFAAPSGSHDHGDGGAGHSHWGVAGADGCRVLGGVRWRIKRHADVPHFKLATTTSTESHLSRFLLCRLTLVGELEGRCRQHHTGHGPFEAMFPN